MPSVISNIIMDNNLLIIDDISSLEQQLKLNKMCSLPETNILTKIKQYLLSRGIENDLIREIHASGFFIDITGKSGLVNKELKIVAILINPRMLSIEEISHVIAHMPITSHAQMDSIVDQMITGMRFVVKLLDDQEKLPLNYTIRCIFQLHNENSTDLNDIQEKECLTGVSEV